MFSMNLQSLILSSFIAHASLAGAATAQEQDLSAQPACSTPAEFVGVKCNPEDNQPIAVFRDCENSEITITFGAIQRQIRSARSRNIDQSIGRAKRELEFYQPICVAR